MKIKCEARFSTKDGRQTRGIHSFPDHQGQVLPFLYVNIMKCPLEFSEIFFQENALAFISRTFGSRWFSY